MNWFGALILLWALCGLLLFVRVYDNEPPENSLHGFIEAVGIVAIGPFVVAGAYVWAVASGWRIVLARQWRRRS